MSEAVKRGVGRVTALTVLAGLALWFADALGGGMEPKEQGWVLLSLTAVFFVSEAFFWKAIEKVSELPQSEALTAEKADQLTAKVQALKQRLTERWFILLTLKAVAGGSAAWLTNQSIPGGPQRMLWLTGVGALAVSLPIALSFVRNWQQADEIKARLMIEAKQQKEQKSALAELNQPPDNPLKADKALKGYAKVVGTAKRTTTG